MTNKEALEILVSKTSLLNNTCSSLNNCIKSKRCVLNTPCETCDDYNLVMTIKQDLDLLEQLKKDLKTTNEFNKKLREENFKYKKAIKILKDTLELPLENDFDFVNKDDILLYRLRIKALINEQEYELLKEVLGYE